MRRITVISFLLFALLGWAAGQVSERNVEHAERMWEAVIQAKGGRTLLRNVRTLGIQAQDDGTQGLRSFHSYSREVYEFPSRMWMRALDLPYRRNLPQFIILEALDGETGLGWLYSPDSSDQHNGLKWSEPREPKMVTRMAKEKMCQVTELLLLESKWYQPKIVAVDETTWNKREVLAIYVKSCSGPAAYVVDPRTKLPLAFIRFPVHEFGKKLPPLPNKYRYGEWRFDDYAPVDGIMMPRKTFLGDATYEINREYSRSLFTKRPELTDWGPWPPPRP